MEPSERWMHLLPFPKRPWPQRHRASQEAGGVPEPSPASLNFVSHPATGPAGWPPSVDPGTGFWGCTSERRAACPICLPATSELQFDGSLWGGGVPGTRLRSRDTTRHLLQRAPKTLASNGTNTRALVAQLCQKPTSLLPGFLVASVVPDIRPCACRPAPACLSCLGRDMGARLFDKQEASGVASIYPLTFANRQHRTRRPSDGQGVCCKHKETTSVAVSGWNQVETCIDAPGCHIR